MNIPIIYHHAKNQEKLMTHSSEKYRTDEQTERQTDRQTNRQTDNGDFIGPFVGRGFRFSQTFWNCYQTPLY